MAALSVPPEAALGLAFRHSMIPRPASKRNPAEAESSPKSVIADVRFVSPGSSSCSSIERRSLPDVSQLKSQPRYGRGYSTSDGELSDPDSTCTSRELNKVGNSGPLESLPETQSLAPEPATSTDPVPATKRGDGEPSYRIPLFPSASGADRASSVSKALPVGDENRSEPNGEWLRTAESAPEEFGKESLSSSLGRYTGSESGAARRRDHGSRATFSAELSSSGKPLERGDESIARRPAGPGAAASFGYSGTPLRFFPGWQAPLNTTHAYSPSPKAPASYKLTPTSSDVGLRLQHRFLSGPITGSMIPKPPPSKWDDAEKWIVSPGRKESPTQPHRSLQTLLTGRRHSIAGDRQSIRSHHGSPDYSTPPGEKPMTSEFQNAFVSAGKVDVPKRSISQRTSSKALSFNDGSRKVDPSRAVSSKSPQQVNRQAGSQKAKTSAAPSSTDTKTKPSGNDKFIKLNEQSLLAHNVLERKEQLKADYPQETTGSIANTSSDDSKDGQVWEHGPSDLVKELGTVSVSLQEATRSCRDMGTQMTPVGSVKNSTCTTPGVVSSPTRCCNTPVGRRASSLGATPVAVDLLEFQGCHLAKLELRQLAGDDQPSLDRKAVWTTREEEELESSASLREDPEDPDNRCQLGTKATAWEEAEQTKTLIRYQNKEAKIKAWEEHQNAQAEAEMKKVEVKVEKILADANGKMKDSLALACKKAAEMRAAAESARSRQAAKIAVQAELRRKAGLLSPSKSSFRHCFPVLRS